MIRVDVLENDLIRRRKELAQRRHRLEDEQKALAEQLGVGVSKYKTAELESESTELGSSTVCSPLVREMGISSYVRYIQQHKYDNDKYALSYHSLDTPNDYLAHQLDRCVEYIIKLGKVVLP